MIINLSQKGGSSRVISGRTDLTQCLISEYGTAGGNWHSINIQDKMPANLRGDPYNDGDTNGFYLGYGQWNNGTGQWDNFRPRLTITMPKGLVATGEKILTIKLRGRQLLHPDHMQAHLSTTKTATSDHDLVTDDIILTSSPLYADETGTIIQTESLDEETSLNTYNYFIFKYNFQPSTTYYIYILPYNEDGEIDYSKTWTKWCNFPSYTYVYLDGTIEGA